MHVSTKNRTLSVDLKNRTEEFLSTLDQTIEEGFKRAGDRRDTETLKEAFVELLEELKSGQQHGKCDRGLNTLKGINYVLENTEFFKRQTWSEKARQLTLDLWYYCCTLEDFPRR